MCGGGRGSCLRHSEVTSIYPRPRVLWAPCSQTDPVAVLIISVVVLSVVADKFLNL